MAMLLVISVFKCRYHLVQKKKVQKQTSENNFQRIFFFFFFLNENGMFEIFAWGKFLHKECSHIFWQKKLEFFVENVVEGNCKLFQIFPPKVLVCI